MREFNFSLKKEIIGGLRPDDRLPRNSGFLTKCQGIRPDILPGGMRDLTKYTAPTSPFAAGYLAGQGVSVAFPFPQLIKGRGSSWLVDDTDIYDATEAANWTIAAATTYDAYATGTAKAIISGNAWHLADFGKSFALFNGSCIVFKRYNEGMFGGTDPMLVVDDITVQTGCAFNGRMVMGGFSTTDFYNDAWENFLRDKFDQGFGMAFPDMLGTNFVWWSPVGHSAFWIVYPTDTLLGIVDEADNVPHDWDNTKLQELMESGEMGFMPMRWQGNVLNTKPLGKGVMVYGDNGVSYMPLKQVDGVSTFGLNDVLPYGVANRSSVGTNTPNQAGEITEHVFVDEAGWLWRMKAGEAPEKLGYREFFENMLSSGDIVINYDPIENDYYISDGSITYVLSEGGLFEVNDLPTSTAVSLGGTVWVADSVGDADDAYAILVTDVFNMKLNMSKTITRVSVHCTNTTDVSVAVDWRVKTSDSWSRTLYQDINYEGEAHFPVSGTEFRLVIRSIDLTTLDIDDIVVHFQTTDKRELRGAYAS